VSNAKSDLVKITKQDSKIDNKTDTEVEKNMLVDKEDTPPSGTTTNPDDASSDGKKIEMVRVEQRPPEDLKGVMGRQNADYWTQPIWPNWTEMVKPVNYVLRGDGLWEVRQNAVGFFCVHAAKAKLPGFPKENNAPFHALRNGKIPYVLLQEIIYFFKKVCDDSKDEVYMQIFWDTENNRYYNHCPLQEVSGASVDYQRDPELEESHVLALEIHSHNTMGAYFSPVDDADEKADRYYGVVGELGKSTPALKFSYVCGGTRQIIGLEGIFQEAPENEEELFPREWLKRVTKKSYTTHGGSSHSHHTTHHNAGASRYQHQSAGSSSSSSNRSVGGESSSLERRSAGGWDTAKIEKEIEEAAKEAKREVDSKIEACDFLRDDSVASEPAVSGDKVPLPVKGTISNSPEKTTTTSGSSGDSDSDYDDYLAGIIGQIEEAIIQHGAMEIDMNKEEKTRLFAGLVTCLEDDDISLFVEQILDQDREGVVYDTLKIVTVDSDDGSREG
jgi:PRTRC genetic system protein A